MANSSILAWRIPWTEESGGPMGSQTVVHDRAHTHTCMHTHTHMHAHTHTLNSVSRAECHSTWIIAAIDNFPV